MRRNAVIGAPLLPEKLQATPRSPCFIVGGNRQDASTRFDPVTISIQIIKSSITIVVNVAAKYISIQISHSHRAITINFSSIFIRWIIIISSAHLNPNTATYAWGKGVGVDFILVIPSECRGCHDKQSQDTNRIFHTIILISICRRKVEWNRVLEPEFVSCHLDS